MTVKMHKQAWFLALLLVFQYSTVFANSDGSVVFKSEAAPVTPLLAGSACTYNLVQPDASLLDPSHPPVVKNIITVSLLENQYVLPDGFAATVTLDIKTGPDLSTAQNAAGISKSVVVNYSRLPGASYQSKAYISFTGANVVIVTVTGVTATIPASGNNTQTINTLPVSNKSISEVLKLQNAVEVTYHYQLSSNASHLAPVMFSFPTPAPGSDEFVVNWQWPDQSKNNYTELEWAWVEDEMKSFYYDANNNVNTDLLFKNNATRIDLPPGPGFNHYNIPLLYDGTGDLYCRIRTVSIHAGGGSTPGPWAAALNYHFTGHNNQLNWQATTSFAEEGKRKTVIQYFDGSLRGRQTVTKDNSTQTVVTAETFYDKQGRPALQILPAPGINNTIAYQQDLNVFNSQQAKQDPSDIFDLEPVNGTADLSLSTASGTARYYSSANPEINAGNNKNIPDAGGYPYSLTVYTPDGTGRVAAQGGAGEKFQPGSNHETRYFYGKPMQEELDGLFGTEAGDQSHYFKNMVVDANGQTSVSYVDMHGRTIATALAGTPQGTDVKLQGINNATDYTNQNGYRVTGSNLFGNGGNIVKGHTTESISTVLVTSSAATYHLSYTLAASSLPKSFCAGSHDFPYVYDLEIVMVNEGTGAKVLEKNFSGITSESGVEATVTGLEPGSYSVRKTLTLDEAVLQQYLQQYLTPGNGICKTLEQTIQDTYNNSPGKVACEASGYIPSTNFCYVLENDASHQQYLSDFYAKLGVTSQTATAAQQVAANNALAAALKHCASFSAGVSHRLDDIEASMLLDMTPYAGQYASNPSAAGLHSPVNGNTVAYGTMYQAFNIFYTNRYLDLAPGTTPDGFTQQFKKSWAQQLLPYHPEYNKLQYAKQHFQAAYDWAETGAFAQKNTFQEASAAGMVNTILTSADPLFSVADAAPYKSTMDGYIKGAWQTNNGENYSMWQVAYGSVLCANEAVPSGRQACFENAPSAPPAYATSLTAAQLNNWNALVANAGNADLVWQKFKQLYFSEREQLINQLINNAPDAQSSYNASLVAQGFVLHFPATAAQAIQQTGGSTNSPVGGATPWYDPTGTSGPVNQPGINNYNTQHNISVANGYAPVWRSQLLQNKDIAGLPEDKREAVLAALIGTTGATPAQGTGFMGICQRSIDEAHPAGATSCPLPGDDGFTRFEDVFASVIARPEFGLHLSADCNPYVITFPKPYNATPELAGAQTSEVSSCTCGQFYTILSEAEHYDPTINATGAVDLAKLNNYLSAKYGQTITADLFNGLQHCNSLPQILVGGDAACYETQGTGGNLSAGHLPPPSHCQYYYAYTLPVPQPLPYYLACGYAGEPTCTTCGEVNSMAHDFTQLFPRPAGSVAASLPLVPAAGQALTQEEIAYNNLFARYLNYYNGQQLGWTEYLDKLVQANCTVTICAEGGVTSDLSLTGNGNNLSSSSFVAGHSITLLHDYSFTVYGQPLSLTIDPAAQSCGAADPNITVLCPVHQPLNDATGLIVKDKPCQRGFDLIAAQVTHTYQNQLDALKDQFVHDYLEGALATGNRETFTLDYDLNEFHFTLYYYDMAGSLVKTVPPKGVHPIFNDLDPVKPGFITQVRNVRASGNYTNPVVPGHTMVTVYCYNSLGQVISQKTPDAGVSQFWYDALGRLVISQNAKQAEAIGGKKRYSYTLYDQFGRITEVGEKPQASGMSQDIAQNTGSPNSLNNWLNAGDPKTQITRTSYDFAYLPLAGDADAATYLPIFISQQNLRGRVSYSEVFDLEPSYNNGAAQPSAFHNSATYYTYDVHGNVNVLLQDYGNSTAHANPMNSNGNRFKVLQYDYDLISGKVNKVAYQPSYRYNNMEYTNPDALYHVYEYDDENRLVKVQTSHDDIYYEQEASYSYYKHGPLMQSILGEEGVQNLNYAYTLQGWLKSVNAGWDGTVAPADGSLAPVTGFSLHYYEGDYRPIGNTGYTDGMFARFNNIGTAYRRPLYNGNIAAMAVNIPALALKNTSAAGKPLVYNYQYDQLNRIVSMDAFSSPNSSFTALTKIDDYAERVSYDPNGNIMGYQRNGNPSGGFSTQMDNLAYHYRTVNGEPINQLAYIGDVIPNNSYSTDIDNQAPGYYSYDNIGNLVKSGDDVISWTVYGKIAGVSKNNGAAVTSYTYDIAGNRISKTVTKTTGGQSSAVTTWYVRDASGNVMGIYTADPAVAGGHLLLTETPLYGSGRLGEWKGKTDVQTPVNSNFTLADGTVATLTSFTRGEKQYELGNHLGNVLVTVSDKKIQGSDDNHNGIIDAAEPAGADVITAQDYYPFGMVMPGRSFTAATTTTNNTTPVCSSCAQLQGYIHDYFATLLNGAGVQTSAGTEAAMLTYIQNQLSAQGQTFSTAQIQTALANCNNGWKQNVANNSTASFYGYDFHTEDFSVEASAYMDADNGEEKPLVAYYYAGAGVVYGYKLYYLNGHIYFKLGDGSAAEDAGGAAEIRTTNTFALNQWYDFVAVRDGNNAANYKIYVNGVLQTTEVVGGHSYLSNGDIFWEYINHRVLVGGGNHVYTKNVRVYRRKLAGTEVAANYNDCSGAPADNTSLVLWGKLNEGTGDPVESTGTATAAYVGYWGGGAGEAQSSACTVQNPQAICTGTGSSQTADGNGYRYGFNGKENDDDIAAGAQDYGMRIYDSRIGKFLSVDPLTPKYPDLTPYQFASNRPIDGIDLDGEEYFKSNKYKVSLWGVCKFRVIDANYSWGDLAKRDMAIHNLILHGLWRTREKELWEPDIETPGDANTMTVKQRASSKKSQAFSNMEAATARREGAADIVGGIKDLIGWGIQTYQDFKYQDEIKYAVASLEALNKADKLVRNAQLSPSFPSNLNTSSFLTDLVNYISDGSLPEADLHYKLAVLTWGNFLLKHDGEINKETHDFNFSPLKTVIKPIVFTPLGGKPINMGISIEKIGNPDPELQKALEMIGTTRQERPNTIKATTP